MLFTPTGTAVHTQGAGEPIEELATIDLNGDAYDDLAFSTRNPDFFKTMVGSAGGLVTNPAPGNSISSGENSFPGEMTVADFTGDGLEDLGGSIWGTGMFAIGQSAGDGNISSATGSPFTFPFVSDEQFRPNQLVSGDFNGDGTPDIASASSNYNPAVNIARAVEVMINRPVPVVAPAALDFPVTGINETSDPLTINIKNDGAPNLVFNTIQVVGGDGKFVLDASGCPGSLGAGEACDIEVEFDPGGSYGTPIATLAIPFFGGVDPVLVPLTGHTPPRMEPDTVTFEFGEAIAGYEPDEKFGYIQFNSTGGEALVLGAPVITGPDATDFHVVNPENCTATPIPRNSSCTLLVEFTPPADGGGFREGYLGFSSTNDPDPSAPVALEGYGRKAEYTVSPTSFDFGDAEIGDNIARVEQVFTVNSTGAGAVAYSGASITGPDADSFSIIGGNTCPPMIDPYDGTCTITVEFHPTSGGVGPRSATLEVDAFSSVAPGPAMASLSGTATNGPAAREARVQAQVEVSEQGQARQDPGSHSRHREPRPQQHQVPGDQGHGPEEVRQGPESNQAHQPGPRQAGNQEVSASR